MSKRRVLLISPSFHQYWSSVGRGLEANGYEVLPFVYDDHGSPVSKLRNKAVYELPARFGLDGGRHLQARRATARARCALRESRADCVIAIRSDIFLDELWEDIHERRLPCVLWLYDELDRMTHSAETLRRFDLVATYSKRDLAELRAIDVNGLHLVNAFDPSMDQAPQAIPAIVFVGARYPGRERTLTELHRRGIPVHAYGRGWSHHPYDRARTWQWKRPPVPASRDVARSKAYGLFAGARATLNLHEDQDGFTMRTFEACGVGGLQLIDRADVDEIYDPGTEIIPFGSRPELEDLCHRALEDRAWAQRVGRAARKRTLAQHTFAHRTRELIARWA